MNNDRAEQGILRRQMDELQMQVAFQENTISALNDALTAQQEQLLRLEILCGRLHSRIEQLSLSEPGPLADERPPHY